ncbi:MAG: penicillin-binding protein 2 [Candidatus Aminicenantales bacterium]
MNHHFQNKARKRTLILTLFLSLWFCGIVLRLIHLQVFSYSRLRAEVLEQNQNNRAILPRRGTIFDRHGKILARSIPAQSVFYIPFKKEPVESQMQTILQLKEILDLSEKDLERIKSRLEKRDHFIWIKRKVDPDKWTTVKSLGLSGIFAQEENKRFYPMGTLAAHILGGVNIDDQGTSGVEFKYNPILQGKKGQAIILRDAKKRTYNLEVIKEAERGKDIILTIDETIQYIAQKELEKAVLENNASWGTVIISHPPSGNILAMASFPTYDPNEYPPPAPELEINRGIRHNFEPGSTFKMITASAALENHSIGLSDTFDCREGVIRVAGRPIRDHNKFKILSFPEVFIHSSNIGTIQVGQKIGENSLYETILTFGFARKTGVGLPGEESGILLPLKSWSRRSLASVSIGYEISVTAIQILQAMNVIANRGILVPPKIVKRVLGSSQRLDEGAGDKKRILSERTASELVSILERVVLEGTGQTAQVNGYTIAGKTGTTQKYDPEIGTYSSLKHLASFVGFTPVDKPALSIIIVLDEPKKSAYYGGQVAAPVFRNISSKVLRYLHIYPQKKQLPGLITAKIWRENDHEAQ